MSEMREPAFSFGEHVYSRPPTRTMSRALLVVRVGVEEVVGHVFENGLDRLAGHVGERGLWIGDGQFGPSSGRA